MRLLPLVLALAATAACRPAASESSPSPNVFDAMVRQARPATGADSAAYLAGAEAVSLFGVPLFAAIQDSASRARLRTDLEDARRKAIARPDDPEALIWLGRRHAYLGQFRLSILVFTEGIRRFPADARFYRHRGHRYITVRHFDLAIMDLERAAALMTGRPDQVEPDGQPNVRNIPIGSLQSNVWYHLALAYYLKGDWQKAAEVARKGITVSSNPDRLVSQTHWLYMALRRSGKSGEAQAVLLPIRDDFDIIENASYARLLKLYKSGVSNAALDSSLASMSSPSDLSLAYGVANWLLYNGDTTRAQATLENILTSAQWPSFGYIAAEADLARLRRGR